MPENPDNGKRRRTHAARERNAYFFISLCAIYESIDLYMNKLCNKPTFYVKL